MTLGSSPISSSLNDSAISDSDEGPRARSPGSQPSETEDNMNWGGKGDTPTMPKSSSDEALLSRIDRLLAYQERLLQHLSPSAGVPPVVFEDSESDNDLKCFVPTSPKTGQSVEDVTVGMLQRAFLDQLVWNLQLAPSGRGIRRFEPITVQVNSQSATGESLLKASFGDSEETKPSERATILWAIREAWNQSLATSDWREDVNLRPALDHCYLKHERHSIRQKAQGKNRPMPFPSQSFLGNALPTSKAKKDDSMTGSMCIMLLRAKADCLCFGDMALLASQMLENVTLCEDLELDDPGWKRRNVIQALLSFMLPFCRNLWSDEDNQWHVPLDGEYRSVTAIRHHFQSLSAFLPPKESKVNGIRLGRQAGSLLSRTPTWLRERRFSIMMLTRYGPPRSAMPPKRYNIVCIVSGGGGEQYLKLDFESIMQKHRLQPCGRMLAPFVSFLVVFLGVLPIWYSSWVSFLDAIDEALSVEPNDILSRDSLADLMHDKSSQHAESHFQIMQLLRIATLWIQTTKKDLNSLRDGIMGGSSRSLDHRWDDQMNRNWEKTLHVLDLQSELLSRRIDKKAEEVKSLRDGLFNAAALREASRGTQINEYLFVFTVMTILYLPLSFVATLYGNSIDFFDFTIPSQKMAFGTCMAVVSVATYAIALSMIWAIRKSDRRQRWRHFRQATSRKLGSLLGTSGSRVIEKDEENDFDGAPSLKAVLRRSFRIPEEEPAV